MPVPIHQSVSVAVIFENGSIKPQYFLWQQKKIVIDAVSFIWRTKIGMADILHFSVIARKTLYELVFDTQGLTWKLEQTEPLTANS